MPLYLLYVKSYSMCFGNSSEQESQSLHFFFFFGAYILVEKNRKTNKNLYSKSYGSICSGENKATRVMRMQRKWVRGGAKCCPIELYRD